MTKFHGRPRDWTPKGFIWSRVLRRHEAPFDRHDWYVQTYSGENQQQQRQEQRYVIDYYYLPNPVDPIHLPPIPYVDARPALDHPRALWLRTRHFLRDAFPGISTYILMMMQQQQQPTSSSLSTTRQATPTTTTTTAAKETSFSSETEKR